MEGDPIKREEYRTEGQWLLEQGGVGHSPIGYHRLGIEDTLARGEWERTRAHAAALESYTSNERLPYTDLLIARGRVLAASGRESAGSRRAKRARATESRCPAVEMAHRLAAGTDDTAHSRTRFAVTKLSCGVFGASCGCNMRAPCSCLFPSTGYEHAQAISPGIPRCRGHRVQPFLGLCRRHHRCRRDISVSDLRQMGRSLQGEDRRRHELPVDRLGRRHRPDQGEDRRFRRLRHAIEARRPAVRGPDAVSRRSSAVSCRS